MAMNSNIRLLFLVMLKLNIIVQLKANVTQLSEQLCDPKFIEKEFFDEFGNDPTFIKVTCFTCVKSICNAEERDDCWKWASVSLLIPIYTNVLEFGFIMKYLNGGGIMAMVHFAKECSIQFSTNNFENGTFTSIVNHCEPICDKELKRWEPENFTNTTVVSFTVLFKDNSNVDVHRSTDAKKISTGLHDPAFTITDSCKYKSTTRLSVQYLIPREPSVEIVKKLPSKKLIALPCSPGGYAMDIKTGTITKDADYIKNAFGDEATLNNIVKELYPDQQLFFAVRGVHEVEDPKMPIYLSDDQIMDIEDMNPCRLVDKAPTQKPTGRPTQPPDGPTTKSPIGPGPGAETEPAKESSQGMLSGSCLLALFSASLSYFSF